MSASIERDEGRPLIGAAAMERMFLRHVIAEKPETRLIVAMLAHAIVECQSRSSVLRRAARRFLSGTDFDLWCDLVGLDPSFARFVAHRAGYLSDETRAVPSNMQKGSAHAGL